MNKKLIIEKNEIVERALRNLEKQTGINGDWTPFRATGDEGLDGKLTLDLNGDKLVLVTEVKKEVRQYQWNRLLEMTDKYGPFLLVARQISPVMKERLRSAAMAYLDSAGNLFIRAQAKWIWIEGNKLAKEENPVPNRAFTKAGLKVVYLLLTQPEAIDMPYREIAGRANVALGNINMVLTGLKEAGYLLRLDRKKVRLKNKRDLLERWIARYGEILKPALHLGNYRFADKNIDWRNLTLKAGDVWGGEPAAYNLTKYLNPEVLTVYTTEQKGKLMRDWKLVPDNKGNVHLYQKFWKDNLEHPMHNAPNLLVYADLMLTNDPRCIDTAEQILIRTKTHFD